MHIHRNLMQEAITLDPTLKQSVKYWTHVLLCSSRKNIHTPHGGNFYFRRPPTPLEFPFYTVGVACHIGPHPLEFGWVPSGKYFCVKYIVFVAQYYYAKDI